MRGVARSARPRFLVPGTTSLVVVLMLSVAGIESALAQRTRPPAAAPAATPPPGWAAYARAFTAYAATDSVVGAGTVMVRGGRIVARADVGWADRAGRVPADERTIYHYGSITKALTAIAIMQLRDRGLLSLDDPVTRWVPELRLIHNAYGSMDAVTIRMLLSHSAGFQNPTWPYGDGRPWEPFEPTRWEQLVAMMPYQQVLFAPDSRYGYSNPAFIYLARIVEAITGDPYQSYIYKNVWGPLGLTRSYFGATPWRLAPWRSHNYTLERDSAAGAAGAAGLAGSGASGGAGERIVDHGAEFDPGITIPNGGWNAPLTDLAAYLAFLGGMAGGDTARAARHADVLARGSLEEMWRGRHAVSGTGAVPDSMGLSFFVYHRGGERLVGHTGTQANFRSFFLLNPRTGDGVVAVFNTSNEVRPRESAAGFAGVMDAAMALLRP